MALSDFYEAIDLETLRRFVSERRQEDLHLEFKTVRSAGLEREDRRNFAEALSGFANADGGVVVWGVDARRDREGTDCAQELKAVSNPTLLMSRLSELTASSVNPSVSGVAHKVVADAASGGHVVTLVPASDKGPHMAKCGEDRYYRRAGSSFRRMEHFEVADMFGRRPHPALALTHRVRKGSLTQVGSTRAVEVVLGIANQGRGSAQAPYLAVHPRVPFRISEFGIGGNLSDGLPKLVTSSDSRWGRYGSHADFVVHPGVTHEIALITGFFDDNDLSVPDLELEYEIAALDHPAVADTLIIRRDDLIAAMKG